MTDLVERIPSVLIANRGEIAQRVVRSCRELGVRSIAVTTSFDSHPTHARFADETVLLPGDTVAETFLNPDLLVATALTSGAAAIHPGYGFLAENADFADLVTGAELAFVGPPGRVIELAGDKIRAREVAKELNVPVLAGTDGEVEDIEEARSFGHEHGYPLAVKAVHGGGGRGIRFVAGEDDLPAALEAALREAAGSFGRRSCFLERALTKPRHVEVQVFGESDGTIRILGDRDCTLQRRRQKLMEECPAPNLPDEVREGMHTHARRIVEEIGYMNAGTCEFLFDRESGDVFFLEVNARLQVEHPVTEMVYGIDLVAAQLFAAAGLPSGLGDTHLEARGHAIEVRINAEEPASGFVPSTGTITRLSLPGGPGVRLDLGIDTGSAVSPVFDSLIGKLICWGRTREAALERSIRAIKEFRVDGVETNLAAARVLLESEAMRSVEHDTGTAESMDFAESPTPDSSVTHIAPWRPAGATRWDVVISGRHFGVALPPAQVDGPADGSGPVGQATVTGSQVPGSSDASSGGLVVSPMSGTVVKANFTVGQHVPHGEPTFVLEAMKMEIEVRAPVSGILVEALVVVGDSVDRGTVLGEIAVQEPNPR